MGNITWKRLELLKEMAIGEIAAGKVPQGKGLLRKVEELRKKKIKEIIRRKNKERGF